MINLLSPSTGFHFSETAIFSWVPFQRYLYTCKQKCTYVFIILSQLSFHPGLTTPTDMTVSTPLGSELHILQQISLWNLAVASAYDQPQHFALTLRYLNTSLLHGSRPMCLSPRVSTVRIESFHLPNGLGALFGLLFSLKWPKC